MTPRDLLTRCAAVGIRLTAEAGRLRVAGPAEAVREFTPLLREHRDELLALLARGAQADGDACHAEGPSAAPDPAEGAADPGVPCGNAWREADAAYQRHHWSCPTCSAAGKACDSRCQTGAALWATYTAQPGSATSKPERQLQAVPGSGTQPTEPPRHPFERERRNWTPATGKELDAMEQRYRRAVALGLDPQQADCAADVLHWRDRTGDDRRLCLECRSLRAGTSSRWYCAAQRLPVPQQLMVQPHRCETFQDLQEGYRGD